jgi:chromosome segregation ATPase
LATTNPVQLNDRKATVNSLQKDTSKLRTKINKILAVFNPALEALVEHASVKFSEAFARVKCSGQLEVDREGDYANWGIKILVAFRDGEALETLKMHRHSGGVSRMVYENPWRVADLSFRNARWQQSRTS